MCWAAGTRQQARQDFTCHFLAQAEHIESGKFAAMKRVPIQDDLELDDFMVEIDILAECKHQNIVGLHEAYFYDQALWVGLCEITLYFMFPTLCIYRSTLNFALAVQWTTLL